MCTVSIITLDDRAGSLRVVCNRDEHRERSRALSPRWHVLPSGRRAVWPMDTHAGGTWIAAAEHGLVLCLLNLSPHPPVSVVDLEGLRSRGELIPGLIGLDDAGGVLDRVRSEPLDRFAPFRLLVIQAGARPAEGLSAGKSGSSGEGAPAGLARIAEARWDRRGLSTVWHQGPPICFVSSGLGDARVLPRLDLFEEMVVEPGPTPERQDEFHRHVWPDRPEVSVLMSRAEARTVSISTVQVGGVGRGSVSMRYEPVPERTGALASGRRPAG